MQKDLDVHPDAHSAQPPEPARRVVWDRDAGREWRVWLADCRGVPGSRGRNCLIFDSGTTMRRVWSPPDDWNTLPDDDLLGLVQRGPSG